MSEENASASKPSKDWLGWLERATQARLCFLVLSVVLAAEVALGLTGNPNLLRLDWASLSKKLDPGVVAVLVAIYLAYMAAISPGLQLVLERLVAELQLRWAGASTSTQRSVELAPSSTHVRPNALRDRALNDKSEFLLNLVTEHEARRRNRHSECEALAEVAFACLGLSLAACWLDASVLRELAFVRWAVPAFFAIAWWLHVKALVFNDDWIYYPPLAQELVEQWHRKHGYAYMRKNEAGREGTKESSPQT